MFAREFGKFAFETASQHVPTSCPNYPGSGHCWKLLEEIEGGRTPSDAHFFRSNIADLKMILLYIYIYSTIVGLVSIVMCTYMCTTQEWFASIDCLAWQCLGRSIKLMASTCHSAPSASAWLRDRPLRCPHHDHPSSHHITSYYRCYIIIPRCSMYGIFTYIYPKNGPNVGKYSIHGASGISVHHLITARRCVLPGRFKWPLSILLQHAQTPAQGQCLEISHTTNPKP